MALLFCAMARARESETTATHGAGPAAYLCYCLAQDGVVAGGHARGRAATYVGCTNNFRRRLRQHNAEICGGARCTTAARRAGAVWIAVYVAEGFVDNHEALSFEWHWKAQTRRLMRQRGAPSDPVRRRSVALDALLRWARFAHIRRRDLLTDAGAARDDNTTNTPVSLAAPAAPAAANTSTTGADSV